MHANKLLCVSVFACKLAQLCLPSLQVVYGLVLHQDTKLNSLCVFVPICTDEDRKAAIATQAQTALQLEGSAELVTSKAKSEEGKQGHGSASG